MEFRLFVVLVATGEEMPVQIVPAQGDDLQVARGIPAWQTDWTSEFLAEPTVGKYAVKATDGELIGKLYIKVGQSDEPGPADFLCKEDKLWQRS